MTDYTKHIEALKESKRNGRLLPDEHRAVDAAIELMQAATPKGAEAERDYCRWRTEEQFHGRHLGLTDVAFLERERAAARAEGFEAMEAACRFNEEQLAAARAEIERLRANYVKAVEDYAAARVEGYVDGKSDAGAEWTEGSVALAGVLAEACDKYEIQLARADKQHDRALDLETKLTNLRAAAERVLDSWDTDEDVNGSHLALRAAIEASK